MLLRCPLCLQKLHPGVNFYRYCPNHADFLDPVALSPDDYSGIYCPSPDCRRLPNIQDGIFLLHEGCPCLSPFWNGRSLDVNRTITIENQPVRHWQLEKLKEIAKLHPTRPEMWFPLIHFRAANELWNGEPLGAAILMSGARNVGKTVLSVMAMCSEYEDLPVERFFHVTPASYDAPAHELLAIFSFLKDLREYQSIKAKISPTGADYISNLKSVCVSLQKAAAGRSGTNVMSTSGFLKRVLVELSGKAEPAERNPADDRPTHAVFSFYDTAGELWQEAGDTGLLHLRSEADVLAVVMDATALKRFHVTSEAANSTWVACERLEQFRMHPCRRSLMVTKLDVVESDPAIQPYLEAVRNQQAPAEKPKALLLRCLDRDSPVEKRLAKLIETDPGLDVFFVWTEGLGTDRSAVSYGLQDFLASCLDLKRHVARMGPR